MSILVKFLAYREFSREFFSASSLYNYKQYGRNLGNGRFTNGVLRMTSNAEPADIKLVPFSYSRSLNDIPTLFKMYLAINIQQFCCDLRSISA